MRRIARRIYADFLMPPRLEEYRRLLLGALDRGYEITSVETFWRFLQAKGSDPGRKFLVLRHDIDTGIRTGRAMWEIDRRLGVRSSFYFRLSTADTGLIREIQADGGEASYHYEELATEAKERGLRTEPEIQAAMPQIRERFRRNLESLRRSTGAPMTIVSSHGDWMNRKLGLPNWILLQDREFRREVGVELEVYDPEFVRHLDSRHCDWNSPQYWETGAPYQALADDTPVVYLLVHPRHWRVDRRDNFREDLGRLLEGIRYG